MDELELRRELSPVIEQANTLVVTTADQYEYAGSFLKQIKNTQGRVAEYWGPLKNRAYDTWKQITSKEKEMLDPLKESENWVKVKMLNFQRIEEQNRLEEQRKLQAQAEEKARRERERLIKEAEKLKTPELKEQRLAEAEMVEAPVITVHKETPKVEGISTRKIWKAEVIDKRNFIVAALNDENLLAYIQIDQSALNKVASATKGAIKYPGIRFYEEEIMSAGGRK